jgi:hypothetical protein
MLAVKSTESETGLLKHSGVIIKPSIHAKCKYPH